VTGTSAAVASLVVAGLVAGGCRHPPVLTQLLEARRLAADVLVQLTKAADASNRAVLAATDDGARDSAQQARQAAQAVRTAIDALAPILQGLGYTDELRILGEFRVRFDEYAALDGRLLDLTVENTNLKAQRLSFGPTQEAADSVHGSLERVARAQPTGAVAADAARVVLAVREIQVLQAPHIAEADDAAMTRLEERMATAQSAARNALTQLESQVRPDSRPLVASARAALDRFNALNAEIVVLSRRNSNVRSLALALGQKRTLTAACEDSINALRAALAKRGFAGTR
jgi:hypothetical protein